MSSRARQLIWRTTSAQGRRHHVRLPWRVRWACIRFSGQRSDYYEYLASCLQSGTRHRSLLELFQADASRHQVNSHRAVLANWWATRYLLCGASLEHTFEGTLPEADVGCLAVTQIAGQQAMAQMLEIMAQRTTMLERCRADFFQTTLAGLVALFVALLVFTLLPMYTLPRVMQAFTVVSDQQLGAFTQALANWVSLVRGWGWLLLVAMVIAVLWLRWSMAHWTGPLRDRFDVHGVWRFMRDLQAIDFLSLTGALVQTLGQRGMALRSIIELQIEFSNPWLRSHLLRMLNAMDLGAEPLEAMRTGLIEEDSWCRLHDVVSAHGLTKGLSRVSSRVLQTLVARIRRQAAVLRWSLLIFSALAVLSMGYWHARVIEEMRLAMLLSLSGI